MPPLPHRVLVVEHVVEVRPARLPVLPGAGDVGAGARLPAHPVAERRRIGQRGGDDVARRDLDAAHVHRLRRVEPELVQRLQHVDELLAEPVLEVDPAAVDPARDQQHLLVLDVHALDRADPLREVEHLGLGERLGRVPAPVALPDHRRVEALLDRRPDREGGREVVALDLEIRAVADPDRVDLGEELVAARSGRRRRRGPARRRSRRARAGRPRSTARPAANWASPSFSPVSSYGAPIARRASSPCRGRCSRRRKRPGRSAG